MEITSSVFAHGQKIPSRYTCDGEGVNPPISIAGVPEGTRSLAMIMDDPDVPTHIREDGLWNHWLVFDMPPSLDRIGENHEPEGIPGVGTSGHTGYFGPCPPDREHRYFLRLYALDTRLDLRPGATRAQLEEAMEGHVIDKAELMGRYERTG